MASTSCCHLAFCKLSLPLAVTLEYLRSCGWSTLILITETGSHLENAPCAGLENEIPQGGLMDGTAQGRVACQPGPALPTPCTPAGSCPPVSRLRLPGLGFLLGTGQDAGAQRCTPEYQTVSYMDAPCSQEVGKDRARIWHAFLQDPTHWVFVFQVAEGLGYDKCCRQCTRLAMGKALFSSSGLSFSFC